MLTAPGDPNIRYGFTFENLYEPDEMRLYRLRPNKRFVRSVGRYSPRMWQLANARWKVWIDALGFRDSQGFIRPSKPEDRQRIIALGDEYTFGMEVTEKAYYTWELQKLLNQSANRKRFEVITAGVPGYSSRQALIYYLTELDRMEPDLLIVQVGTNDAVARLPSFLPERAQLRTDRELFPEPGAPIPEHLQTEIFILGRYFESYPLVRAVRDRFFTDPAAAIRPERPRATPEEFQANLARLHEAARRRGARMVLLKIALPPAYANAIRRFARDTRTPLVDVDYLFESKREHVLNSRLYAPEIEKLQRQIGSFIRRPGNAFLFTVDKRFPNAVGHLLIAEELYNAIRKIPGFNPRAG